MQKKVREGQLAQFNFILVVGEKEAADGTVNVRLRNNTVCCQPTLPTSVLDLCGVAKNMKSQECVLSWFSTPRARTNIHEIACVVTCLVNEAAMG